MNQDPVPYMAYMLRLWLENDRKSVRNGQTHAVWCASLEDPHTQEMQFFADLDALFDFLARETKRRELPEGVSQNTNINEK